MVTKNQRSFPQQTRGKTVRYRRRIKRTHTYTLITLTLRALAPSLVEPAGGREDQCNKIDIHQIRYDWLRPAEGCSLVKSFTHTIISLWILQVFSCTVVDTTHWHETSRFRGISFNTKTGATHTLKTSRVRRPQYKWANYVTKSTFCSKLRRWYHAILLCEVVKLLWHISRGLACDIIKCW